jgi:peroxiredoxin
VAIRIGQEAPDFTLKDQDGEDVTLSSFRGRSNVVLVFFPLAFSGVCTRQLTEIGSHEARYADADAQVIGISVDSRYAQHAFADSLGLRDVRLLADFEPKGEVARRYGVYLDDPGCSTRASFVIDRDGVVRHADVMETPLNVPDEEAQFAVLAACRT